MTLKTAANQSVIELTFFSTLVGVYPTSEANPQNEIFDALQVFDAAVAEQFADKMDLSNAVNRAAAKATTKNLLQATSAALEGISNTLLGDPRVPVAAAEDQLRHGRPDRDAIILLQARSVPRPAGRPIAGLGRALGMQGAGVGLQSTTRPTRRHVGEVQVSRRKSPCTIRARRSRR